MWSFDLSSLPRKGWLDDDDCSQAGHRNGVGRGAEGPVTVALQRAGLPGPPPGRVWWDGGSFLGHPASLRLLPRVTIFPPSAYCDSR